VTFTEDPSDDCVSAKIEVPDGEPIGLTVFRAQMKHQRVVVAERNGAMHRDQINPNSSVSRDRFAKKAAKKFGFRRIRSDRQ